MSKSLTDAIKLEVLSRAKWCYEYCRTQSRYSPDPLSIEHIVPRSGGGANETDNLAAACQGCNNHKFTCTSSIDPVTGFSVPLFDPRREEWNDHFSWDENCTLIVGRTPVGRATVERLRLNRPGLVNLRGILYEAGRHPPMG